MKHTPGSTWQQKELREKLSKQGNPIAQNRFRYQTWSRDTNDSYESDWAQTKEEAIKAAHRVLLREFKKFGVQDMIVKIFNEMNYKQKPIVVTLEEAIKKATECESSST